MIAQVALSLMVLVAASMFFRSFRKTLLESPGFRTGHVLMMSFDPTLVRYTRAKTRQFYETLVERARQVPGVRSATLSQTVPFGTSVATLEMDVLQEFFRQRTDSVSRSISLSLPRSG